MKLCTGLHQNRALNAAEQFAPQIKAEPGNRLKSGAYRQQFGGLIGVQISTELGPSSSSTMKSSAPQSDDAPAGRPAKCMPQKGLVEYRNASFDNPFTGRPYPNNRIPVNPTSAHALELLFRVRTRRPARAWLHSTTS